MEGKHVHLKMYLGKIILCTALVFMIYIYNSRKPTGDVF